MNSLRFGGAEKHTIQLANRLDRVHFDISICYLLDDAPLMEELDISRLSGVTCLNKKNKVDLSVARNLFKCVSSFKPDIVVGTSLYASTYASVLKHVFGIKFRMVEVIHTTVMAESYSHNITKMLYAPLAKRCDKVVFVCKNQMDYWINKYGLSSDNCSYIYNGVDIKYFAPNCTSEDKIHLKKNLDIAADEKVIAICASLRPEKRHIDLLDAVRILISKGFPIKVLIIGDGVERQKIENHIKQNMMTDHVVITGLLRDVRPYVSLADVMVIPSNAVETFSIAVLEAMALGKPIVASDIGGASEQVLNGENGYLFPPGDVNALAYYLEKMMVEDTFGTMGDRSREFVCDKFEIKQMITEYEKLIISI